MDVTSNTVTSENLLSGQTAIGNNGETITGGLVGGPYYGIYDSIMRAGEVYASGSSSYKYTSEDVTNWTNSFSRIDYTTFQGVTFRGSFYFNNVSSYIRNHAFAFGYCNNGTGLTNSAEFYFNNFSSVLDNGVFYYNQNIINVTMPLCTSIKSYAFYSARIKSVNFPVCTEIGTSAFYGCSVSEVSFPACTKIASYAFASCRSLSSVSFPQCTSVGYGVFKDCPSLMNINLPMCSTTGTYAFAGCIGLTSINLPMCSIARNYVFQSCSSLSSINMPACTLIEARAFQNCYNLSIASFSNTITEIGANAFERCYNLISLYLLGSSVPLLTNYGLFSSTPISDYTTSTGGVYGSIYVPSSLYNAYIIASGWSNYSSRIVSV